MAAPEYAAEFALSQVVSHHSIDRVEALLRGLGEARVEIPVVFGVFFYRSANPTTLTRLNDYFPVPERELTEEFRSGASPEEICARTIRALRSVGADKIYVSNLGYRRVESKLAGILALV